MQTVLYIATVKAVATEVGAIGGEGTPVPIPNTEVKLTRVDNTWLETAREDRTVPTQKRKRTDNQSVLHIPP